MKLAIRRLSGVDPTGVADDVESALTRWAATKSASDTSAGCVTAVDTTHPPTTVE